MTTYEVVAELCKQKGIAITTLEKELGFGRGYIGKFKSKGTSPTAKKLQQIADFFGVSIDYLINGKEETADGDTIIQNRDLKKKYREIYELLKSGETAPLYFDGQPADPESIDLLLKQVEISLALIEKSEE